jgi:hypothetical protein
MTLVDILFLWKSIPLIAAPPEPQHNRVEGPVTTVQIAVHIQIMEKNIDRNYYENELHALVPNNYNPPLVNKYLGGPAQARISAMEQLRKNTRDTLSVLFVSGIHLSDRTSMADGIYRHWLGRNYSGVSIGVDSYMRAGVIETKVHECPIPRNETYLYDPPSACLWRNNYFVFLEPDFCSQDPLGASLCTCPTLDARLHQRLYYTRSCSLLQEAGLMVRRTTAEQYRR